MSILSICTQSVFVQLQKCHFFSGGGGGGEEELTSGTCFFDLLLLFLKNALLSLLFHSKMSFTRKNTEFFPCSLGFNKLTNDFFREHAAKHQFFSINFLACTIVTAIILLI